MKFAKTAKTAAESRGPLLSRAEFERQVFLRSKGRCAFCSLAAVDAHHILERKLFPDGGYYLDNGCAVCAAHHWDCETTRISVEEVLVACGLSQARRPPGFGTDTGLSLKLDKWGNRLRCDGLREVGPLFEDTGCRKALQSGGFLGQFVPVGTPEY